MYNFFCVGKYKEDGRNKICGRKYEIDERKSEKARTRAIWNHSVYLGIPATAVEVFDSKEHYLKHKEELKNGNILR
ncbi:hypothetical protein CEW46_21130 [Bacillus cereus]|nr:hypothetical protein CEW46_21130 [Bacillus cereus]